MSYENTSDFQRLRSYGYMRFKIHLTHNIRVIRQSCSIEKSMTWFLSCLLFVQTPYFSCNSRREIEGDPVIAVAKSADHHDQSMSGNCSFRYYVICRPNMGVPRHAGNTSVIVFCVVTINLSLKYPQLRNCGQSQPCSYDISNCKSSQQ
jgi:hypothetical protein